MQRNTTSSSQRKLGSILPLLVIPAQAGIQVRVLASASALALGGNIAACKPSPNPRFAPRPALTRRRSAPRKQRRFAPQAGEGFERIASGNFVASARKC
jgi:hypothetical protein